MHSKPASLPGDPSLEPKPDKLFEQALALYQQGRHMESQNLCSQALKLDPKHLSALQLMGVSLAQNRQFKEAAQIFATVVQINPQD